MSPPAWTQGLRDGLVFMTVHYAESADVNQLTIEAWDPEVGHRRIQGDRGAPGAESSPAPPMRLDVDERVRV